MSAPPHDVGERRQARQQRGGVAGLRRRFGALGGAQLGGAGARIARDFLLVGGDGTPGEQAEARRRALDFRRVARAAARRRALGKEAS